MCKRHVWLTVVWTIAAASVATSADPAWAQRRRPRPPAPPAASPAEQPEPLDDPTEAEPSEPSEAAGPAETEPEVEAEEAPAGDRVDELDERLTYLEEAMDEVEKRAVLDRMQIGLDYRMILNRFSYHGPDPTSPLTGGRVNRTTAEVWSHRLIVPMRADITPSLRFTARLGMFKHFGDNDQAPFFLDFQGTRVPRDAGLRVEHAWLDWFATDWLALSAGRLSYLGRNPPGDLKEHAGYRIPTWGLNLIDGEYEAATVTLTPWRKKLPDLYIRAFYVSWFSDFDDPRGELAFLGSGQPNPRIIGAIADLRIPKLDRTYLQLGYLTAPRFPALPIPITDPAYNPGQDFTNAPAPFNGSLLFPSVLPDSLGSVHSVSVLLEALDHDIGGLVLDGFFGAALNIASPSGDAIEYELPNPADPTTRVSTPFFVLVSDGDTTLSTSVLTGLRLALPKWKLPEPARLGLEYNYGSRYSISFAVPSDQLVSKWTVRGQAIDAYLILPVYRDRMFVRLGVLFLDNQYFNGIVGLNPALPAASGEVIPEVAQDVLNYNMVVQVTL
ncbi:MAG TPA: DUF3373 family protein [Haliangium sp.]|nr:DUF3373 family protein [Haliangium sp.]